MKPEDMEQQRKSTKKRRRSRQSASGGPSSSQESAAAFYSDHPIERPDEDLFGRSTFAANFAKSIEAMPGPEPFVFGLSGPWGSGKTSLMNMVEHELRVSDGNVTVFHFNPWWFSGSDALLISFFHDFAKVLITAIKGNASKKLAKYLSIFGHLLKPAKFIPGLNIPAEALAELAAAGGKAIKEAGELASQDAMGIRRDIDQLLLKRRQPVLVIVDDIDRLLPEEVIQVFRIVKAVADFPFVRYLMAYDDVKICSTVKASMGIEGREFLEKIIQMPIELPPIAQSQLNRLFLAGLNRIVGNIPEHLMDTTRFGNVFHDGIAPFLTSPRTVKRLLNVLRVTYPPLRGEVELADFVAIQTLMVFAPDVHRFVRDESHWFVGRLERGSGEETEAFHERWKTLGRPEIMEPITSLLKRTFPRFESLMGGAGYSDEFESIWSSHAQAASERHFPKYFTMSLDEGTISEAELSAFLGKLDDSIATDAWLKNQLKAKGPGGECTRAGEALTVLSNIAQAKARLNDEQRGHLLESLLRVSDELAAVSDTERIPGFFPINNDLRIIWILRGLTEGIRDLAQRGSTLESAFKQGMSCRTMLDFARNLCSEHGMFGSQKEPGEMALLSKDTCESLADTAVAKVKEMASKGLLGSVTNPMDLGRLWAMMGDKKEAIAWVRSVCTADASFLAVVRGAVSEGYSWGLGGFGSMGDRVARTSLMMAVEYMCSFFEPLALRDRAKNLLENQALVKSLDKETIFGLEQLRDRIRSDGSVIPVKDKFDED